MDRRMRGLVEGLRKAKDKVKQRVAHETKGIEKVTPQNQNPRNPKNPTLYQRAQILAGGTEDAGSVRGELASAKHNIKAKLFNGKEREQARRNKVLQEAHRRNPKILRYEDIPKDPGMNLPSDHNFNPSPPTRVRKRNPLTKAVGLAVPPVMVSDAIKNAPRGEKLRSLKQEPRRVIEDTYYSGPKKAFKNIKTRAKARKKRGFRDLGDDRILGS